MDAKTKEAAESRLKDITEKWDHLSKTRRGNSASNASEPASIEEVELNAETGEVGGTMGAGLGGTAASNGE